jgi:hypothetical protein
MLHILFALVLALVVSEATGIASMLAGDECNERCPGDAPDGTCPPDCQSCACCSLPRVLAPQLAGLVPLPVAHRMVWASQHAVPSSPEPAEILHIPKLLRVFAI